MRSPIARAVLCAALLSAFAEPALSQAQPASAEGAAEADASVAHEVADFLARQRASAHFRTNYFRSSKAFDDDTGFLGATVQLKALPTVTDSVDGKVELRITNPSLGEGGPTRTVLLEGYMTVHFERADLRIGKQIVAWGRADGINPTDNLTPRDYTVLLPFEDDQRFGTPAAKLDLFVSQDYTVTLFASPFFEPAKIPVPSAAGPVTEHTPARKLSNTSAAIKLNKTGEGVDWSVSYFRGFALLPGLRPASGAMSSDSAMELHYDRITVLGADIARNFGRFGLRGEVAYVDTPDDAGTDVAIRNPYIHWIAGVDRTFLANLNVNFQFFQRRVRSYRAPANDVALQNSLIDGQRDRESNGITFRVSNKWFHDTLEAEIFGVFNLTRDDYFVRPLITYAFSDRLKGTLGAELYQGAHDTQYGSLKPNRGAFAELRYGF